MSVMSEIERLEGAKIALATSIEGKGVAVPAGTKIDGMAALVDQISTRGGGGEQLEKLFEKSVSMILDASYSAWNTTLTVDPFDVPAGRYKAVFTYGGTTVEGYATLDGGQWSDKVISAPFCRAEHCSGNYGVGIVGLGVGINPSGNCVFYCYGAMGSMETAVVKVAVYRVLEAT